MLIPLNWLQNYIKLEHTPKEFGDIMTDLEFMQDGPIAETKVGHVIDLEVRQNRPDALSILGIAGEYAAFVSKKIDFPKLEEIPKGTLVKNGLFNVEAKDVVKRFYAVQVENITVNESPNFIKQALIGMGLEPQNNIIDITNFVMFEMGIPMHAFDLDNLTKENDGYLTLRMANDGEQLTTWQGTKTTLTKNDLVVADTNKRVVSIGGITGEPESGVSDKTTNILLEAANYNHAAIRRTAARHNVYTESSNRHSKFLASDLVEYAIQRALFLIKEHAGGKIVTAQDWYEQKQQAKTIEYSFSETNRFAGTNIDINLQIELLTRLGFNVEKIDENKANVTAPTWRTDINYSEDIVEEILRLWGYEKIPNQPINTAPPKNITEPKLILEDKLRDILMSLSYSEHITEPLVKADNSKNQIVLENPLNKDKNALRTNIKTTLAEAIKTYKKAGNKQSKFFEIGKVYKAQSTNFTESNRLQVLVDNYGFYTLKSDLMSVFKSLGIMPNVKKDNPSKYYVNNSLVAVLQEASFELYTDNIIKNIDLNNVPVVAYNVEFIQTIQEQITTHVNNKDNLEDIANKIKELDKNISAVYVKEPKTDLYSKKDSLAVTYTIVYTDKNNKLSSNDIAKKRKKIIDLLENTLNFKVDRA
jgi:phenylalanyl-tRNA synthetase beta chain